MNVVIFDIEGDGLYPSKIHVMAWKKGDKYLTTSNYNIMRSVLKKADVLIGHNIIGFDIPVLERLLKIKIKAKLVDTLALSWYVYPNRIIHGLDSWGEDYNIPKPKIDDWENLTYEEYAHRCIEDVKINYKLWIDIKKKLLTLYGSWKDAKRLVEYLSFKMECASYAEHSKIKLDLDLINKSITTLEEEQKQKVSQLKEVMPKVPIIAKRTKPAKPFKKDGTLSVTGSKWQHLLRSHNLPKDYEGIIEEQTGESEANPNSPQQVKDWLFSLGWKPTTFKFVKEDDGERQIPQIRKEGELCESVIRLIDKHPDIQLLEGLSVIQHRLGIFNSFLREQDDGYVSAQIAGLTNTLRFKHKSPLVNLPGVDKVWGKEIRGALLAPDNYVMVGSDMVSLEDNTKRHYMYPYDPEYVEEMSQPGFDPHLDLALHAGAITQEELSKWKQGDKETKELLTPIRKSYKQTNYSCIYGVGGPKLARELGIKLKEANKLREDYWKRNWSIKKLAEDTLTKTIDGEMWLFNPVSKLWYSLRYEKDIFSTLNQGTGVYCFDCWIREWRKDYPDILAQFHDEIVTVVFDDADSRNFVEKILKDAIQRVNDKLKLNIKLDVDIKFGYNYAEIH